MSNVDCSTSAEVLEKMPFGVLIVEKGKVEWANQALLNTLHVTKDQLIGLQAEQASSSVFAPLFDQSEKLCLTESNGGTRWFKRECVNLEGSERVAHYFKDITELAELEEQRNKLRNEVCLLETKDPATGLLNRKAILQALETQLSRSRRYENPLSLLRLSLHSTDKANTYELLRGMGQSLKDQLRWADQIGMLDDTTFLIVLPETCLDDAKELASNLACNRAAVLAVNTSDWSIKFGVAAWQKGDDSRKVLGRLQRDQDLSLIALLS